MHDHKFIRYETDLHVPNFLAQTTFYQNLPCDRQLIALGSKPDKNLCLSSTAVQCTSNLTLLPIFSDTLPS